MCSFKVFNKLEEEDLFMLRKLNFLALLEGLLNFTQLQSCLPALC